MHTKQVASAVCALSFFASLPAQAQTINSLNPFAPPPPKWTATFGLQGSKAKSTQAASPSTTDSVSGSVSLMRQLDDETFVGGNLAYTNSRTETNRDSGEADSDVYAGGLFAMRSLQPTLLLDGALGYGGVALNNRYNNGTAIRYDADTNFWSAGVGLTKLFPVSPSLTASLSMRYTYLSSRTDDYVDSANNRSDARTTSLHYISPGGGLNWRFGNWEPYVNASWNLAEKDFVAGTNDREYFSYGFGTNYVLTKATYISAGFSGVLGKTDSREHSLLIGVTTKF